MLWGGWGERKGERAGHDGKGNERLPIVPRALSIFSTFYFYFYRNTQREPLRRRGEVTEEDSTGASGVFKTYMPCLVYGQNFSRHHESEPPERYDVFLCTVCNCIAWNTPSRKYMMEEPHILISLPT